MIKEVLTMTLLSYKYTSISQVYKCLTEEQSAKCEILISEDELICALKNMPKIKSPGNDGLTKEF